MDALGAFLVVFLALLVLVLVGLMIMSFFKMIFTPRKPQPRQSSSSVGAGVFIVIGTFMGWASITLANHKPSQIPVAAPSEPEYQPATKNLFGQTVDPVTGRPYVFVHDQ